MYFDYFTAAALVDELNTALAGGRVQDVLAIDDLSIGLEIYSNHQRHYLYLSAVPEEPRLHLVGGKLRRGLPQPPPLVLQLNRYVEGGQIAAVRQPPWERIVIFDILSKEGEFSLVVEPIERRANILLVEHDTIRECIRRVKADENRVRQLLPGQPYQPPPPQNKLEPQQVTVQDIERFLENDIGAKVPQALTRGILGLSPLLAWEIAYRAMGKPNGRAADAYPDEIYAALQELITPLLDHEWQAGYVLEEDEVTAYAVYPLTHRGEWHAAETPSQALVAYYGPLSGDHAYDAAKRPLREQLKAAQKKVRSKLYNLRQQRRDDAELERLRQSGELLLAYQYQIEPKQIEFTAQYDPDGDPLIIKLDPTLTPVENAQRYFEKYDKAKRSRQSLPRLILQTEREVRYLAQLEADVLMAANWTEIGEVQEALQEGGYWQGPKRKQTTGKSSPLKVVLADGTLIWVGRNTRQNEEVTFKKGSPDDMWLHARGVPGAHVIVKTSGRAVDEDLLHKAASLAVYYSEARANKAAEVIVTERKHIRKIKGGKPGMVTIAKETHPSIQAVPLSEDEI